MNTFLLWVKRLLIAITILFILGFSLPRLYTGVVSRSKIIPANEAPYFPVAIVFGAGLKHDGAPTAVLKDRVLTGVELYRSGKVKKLLMSGDNSHYSYNEPGAMQDYALELGIPSEDIVLDYAGRRTYDTCFRAKYIFGIDRALIVTQSFHLPRALFLCSQFGIESIGVKADQRQYTKRAQMYWNLRELPASLTALWDAWIWKPLPIMGDPEPIFPEPARN